MEKKLREISVETGLSVNACYQALKHFNSTGSCLNKIRTRCRKTSSREDRIIRRISEADRHKTAVDIHKEVASQLSSPIAVRTVQNRLNEFGFMGRVARKKPFISKKNKLERLKFANEHKEWTNDQCQRL